MSHSVKSIRKQFAERGVFYTDLRLAERLKEIVSAVTPITEVYDPTCGCGNLLSVFPDYVTKYGQELDGEQAEEAAKLPNAHIVAGDTLAAPAFVNHKFRHIVANYPFSVKWTPHADERWSAAPCLPPPSRADYAFILHILSMLADDGIAAVLGFPGILYRGQKEGTIRRWLVERNVIDSVTMIEGGYFEDTKIATVLIVFRKNRSSNTIRFADNLSGKDITVGIEQVKKMILI